MYVYQRPVYHLAFQTENARSHFHFSPMEINQELPLAAGRYGTAQELPGAKAETTPVL